MEFCGTVVEGKHLGHTLGFPTINILPADPFPTKRGVYAAKAWIDGIDTPFACMLNIGAHPTAPEGPPTIEGHLLDFDGDCYGKHVRVKTVAFLRRERRFPSLEDLIAQLNRDRERVRACVTPETEQPPSA